MDLFSPTTLGLIAAVMIGAIVIYIFTKMKPQREVLYLRERDRRAQRLSITEETATSLLCRSRKGITRRFFKWGGSWTLSEAGKMKTLFLGKEGTAYTYKPIQADKDEEGNPVESTETVTVPEEVQCTECGEVFNWDVTVPVKVTKKGILGTLTGTIEESIKTLWGEKFFNEIPKKQRKMLEGSKLFVTVDMEPGLTPENYTPISEDDVEDEMDRDAAKIFGQGLGSALKAQLYQGMLWAALGGLGVFVLYNVGVFN